MEYSPISNPAFPWMQTFSGIQFAPMAPEPQFSLKDIVWALSHVNRYSGHCLWPYSVLHHSCFIASRMFIDIGDSKLALQGLMHDATEAYMGDVPRPIKRLVPKYTEVEEQMQKQLFTHFGIDPVMDPRVKDYDNRILMDERTQVLGKVDYDWGWSPPPLGIRIIPKEPRVIRKWFMELFNAYGGKDPDAV